MGDPGMFKSLAIELRVGGLERIKEPGLEDGLKMLPGAEARAFLEVEPRPRPRLGPLELETLEPDVLGIAIPSRRKRSVRQYVNDWSDEGRKEGWRDGIS